MGGRQVLGCGAVRVGRRSVRYVDAAGSILVIEDGDDSCGRGLSFYNTRH